MVGKVKSEERYSAANVFSLHIFRLQYLVVKGQQVNIQFYYSLCLISGKASAVSFQFLEQVVDGLGRQSGGESCQLIAERRMESASDSLCFHKFAEMNVGEGFTQNFSCIRKLCETVCVRAQSKQWCSFITFYCIYAAKVRNVFVLLRDYIKEIEP